LIRLNNITYSRDEELNWLTQVLSSRIIKVEQMPQKGDYKQVRIDLNTADMHNRIHEDISQLIARHKPPGNGKP
jgi:hypothetical protein